MASVRSRGVTRKKNSVRPGNPTAPCTPEAHEVNITRIPVEVQDSKSQPDFRGPECIGRRREHQPLAPVGRKIESSRELTVVSISSVQEGRKGDCKDNARGDKVEESLPSHGHRAYRRRLGATRRMVGRKRKIEAPITSGWGATSGFRPFDRRAWKKG